MTDDLLSATAPGSRENHPRPEIRLVREPSVIPSIDDVLAGATQREVGGAFGILL